MIVVLAQKKLQNQAIVVLQDDVTEGERVAVSNVMDAQESHNVRELIIVVLLDDALEDDAQQNESEQEILIVDTFSFQPTMTIDTSWKVDISGTDTDEREELSLDSSLHGAEGDLEKVTLKMKLC